ncbi:MAG TPA: hypothetical protein VFQ43_13705 [Nitrososphaera sp.]|nr:hypothetical protein [Nitrososphaera sp.]
MSEERLWFNFEDPTKMSLLLGSAVHGARQLLEEGKIEEAKQVLDCAMNEMAKYKLPDSDKLTALYFGNRNKL